MGLPCTISLSCKVRTRSDRTNKPRPGPTTWGLAAVVVHGVCGAAGEGTAHGQLYDICKYIFFFLYHHSASLFVMDY